MGELEDLLAGFREGRFSLEETVGLIQKAGEKDLGHAVLDLDRRRRTGDAEVVYCAGKTSAQVAEIVESLLEAGQRVLATRADPEKAEAVLSRFPDAAYHETARIVTAGKAPDASGRPVAVVGAGTSDLPVIEEAAVTAEFFGHEVIRAVDVGVAGLHRLLNRIDGIRKARAVVAVAGMEGALPSVLAGLVDLPVVAVPTSVGYGANLGGITALLAMVNSCASGVSVVNIDNGFGGAYVAHLIAK